MRSNTLDFNPSTLVTAVSSLLTEEAHVINVNSNTATITVPAGLPVGTRKVIRRLPDVYTSDADIVSIAFSGAEVEYGSGATTIPIYGESGFWIIEKVSATEWLKSNGSDQGSNSNGNYVIFPNGLQICWWEGDRTDISATNAYGTLFQGLFTWTFPEAFASPPSVWCGKAWHGTAASWVGHGSSNSTTLAYFRLMDVGSRAAGTKVEVAYGAIGMAG